MSELMQTLSSWSFWEEVAQWGLIAFLVFYRRGVVVHWHSAQPELPTPEQQEQIKHLWETPL